MLQVDGETRIKLPDMSRGDAVAVSQNEMLPPILTSCRPSNSFLARTADYDIESSILGLEHDGVGEYGVTFLGEPFIPRISPRQVLTMSREDHSSSPQRILDTVLRHPEMLADAPLTVQTENVRSQHAEGNHRRVGFYATLRPDGDFGYLAKERFAIAKSLGRGTDSGFGATVLQIVDIVFTPETTEQQQATRVAAIEDRISASISDREITLRPVDIIEAIWVKKATAEA